MTIKEFFGNPHNPVIRWIPGDNSTIRVESGLTPASEGYITGARFEHCEDFCDCLGECSPETDIPDSEWDAFLETIAEGLATSEDDE